ncbi:hypothetical protein A3C20_01505 [Candidatus Kaiserbacteria bacterium RIFCSPHIGHO2_02_FULL_55_25]|uniref:Uncharacterized protein n=1 Tax=Candidatus Kaiserbacteria bacterium RIFCSPHIGHO2_02_FULL_55_25 TaxID=1798498 RepID=A0A1F6E628_9BACT|nr:MAG: hypothetical protein A2764_00740 [Candidatus Kaiserbacteria bacterium RIFCSPHIGHO2_01_FULL_55_79]OGG69000.1 MAG: hypothetical protein A3C20_01505 [Candidatus Kaiserbacteria bacterium RIFCSPHIGHO2_02_FULL_55_25]OGG77352.1 MAG: hypothetical protein A3F56_03930 [Candidatus Kaiserbacteria bacterium RIFCSPHIGHO2_12_FULL_55_13]OGG82616.1 MAG: hypothetical protein A3A42_00755 [Candidatus Kaiserbacteria bacterium RIFCSPLOWO2_01_FULL_55_25]
MLASKTHFVQSLLVGRQKQTAGPLTRAGRIYYFLTCAKQLLIIESVELLLGTGPACEQKPVQPVHRALRFQHMSSFERAAYICSEPVLCVCDDVPSEQNRVGYLTEYPLKGKRTLLDVGICIIQGAEITSPARALQFAMTGELHRAPFPFQFRADSETILYVSLWFA